MKPSVQGIVTLLSCVATAAAQTATLGPLTAGVGAARPPGCPTITQTREVCSTCVTLACIVESTVTRSCGCPARLATAFLDFPCDVGCAGLSCATSYRAVADEEGLSSCAGGSGSASHSTSSGSGSGGGGTTSTSSGASPSSTGTSITTRLPPAPTTTNATLPSPSGPASNPAGRPRPFRLWL